MRPPAPRTVAITFDDAYRSVIELAFPILSRAGFTATVFAPTSFVGTEEPMAWPGIDHWRDTEHAAELTPMSWEELGRLAEAGWEVGSHTRSHPRLPEIDDAALDVELRSSREEVARHLGPCVSCLSVRRPRRPGGRGGEAGGLRGRGDPPREAEAGWTARTGLGSSSLGRTTHVASA